MSARDELSKAAQRALDGATGWCVSAASLYEIPYKAMLGKWPELFPLLAIDLDARLRADGFEVVPATGAILQRAGGLEWAHPFDRIIVATALTRGLPVVSKDVSLDSNGSSEWTRIW
jgi:PIN domain nuclease of toxin-antitoxin system